MAKKNTHKGFLIGCDARTPNGFKKEVELRETKLYWIHYSNKYRKDYDGKLAGESWPLYSLDLSTIKPLED